MVYNRKILENLTEWKHSELRKPLILRGARQVGKTTIVKHFANTYKSSVFLNLEKPSERSYFEKFDEVKEIVDAVLLSKGLSLDFKQTLFFIDEIQESPKAIALLRYFYEELPELHVIASGSLLEFAFKDVSSFPVGRVEYRYLGPFSFEEFLLATGKSLLAQELHKVPINKIAHDLLLNEYHKYALVGGMPEAIKTYIINNSIADVQRIYESIWQTYKDDIEKYANNDLERKVIRHLMNTAPFYLDKRITFQNFGNSNYRSREVSEAFEALSKAKIVRLVYPTSDFKTPLLPYLNKSPRLQFVDTGIVNYALKIQLDLMAKQDLSDAYRGAIIPHLIFQELVSNTIYNDELPFFWVRDKKQSSAEIDILRQVKNRVIPVEIKSGKKGKLRSLHQYIEESGEYYAVRLYAGNYIIEEAVTPKGTPYKLMNLPYYLGSKLDDYIDLFLENY